MAITSGYAASCIFERRPAPEDGNRGDAKVRQGKEGKTAEAVQASGSSHLGPLVTCRAARLGEGQSASTGAWDSLAERPFAGTGAWPRIGDVEPSRCASDSAPGLRTPGAEAVPQQSTFCVLCQVELHSRLAEAGSAG